MVDRKKHMVYHLLQKYPDARPACGDCLMASFKYNQEEGLELWFHHTVEGSDIPSTGCLYENRMIAEIETLANTKGYVGWPPISA